MKKVLLMFVGILACLPGLGQADRVDLTLSWPGREALQARQADAVTVLDAAVTPASAVTRREPLSDSELIVVGLDERGEELYRVVADDPSRVRAEIFDPVTGQIEESHDVVQDADELRLTLPNDEAARRLAIYRPRFDEQGDYTLELLAEVEFPDLTRKIGSAELLQLESAAAATTVVNNGDPSNRIDMVFLGDGYTAADQGKFAQDVDNVVRNYFNIEPYKSYAGFFNVHRVDVISNESGVDHPELGILRDTAFDATYNCQGIQRLICASTRKARQAAEAALPAGSRDVIVVIVNDNEYGGSGGSVAVISTHASTVWLALHELGHSYGLLADEYTFNPELCDPSEPDEVNSTTILDRNATKWTHWIDSATPLPTPDSFGSAPGLYLGSRYCTSGMYRPTFNSMMRTLSVPFFAVNEEALIRRHYAFVRPIDALSPTSAVVSLPRHKRRTFSIVTPPVAGDTIEVSWLLNNKRAGAGDSFTLSCGKLRTGLHTLTAVARDVTSKVRKDVGNSLVQRHSWTILVGNAKCAAPRAPAKLTDRRLTPNSFNVSWREARSAYSYDLQLWSNDGWRDYASTHELNHTFVGLTGVQYVRVRARNGCGGSDYSKPIKVD